jgi:LEA14-like dessication related protein
MTHAPSRPHLASVLWLGILTFGCASTPLLGPEVLVPDVFLTNVSPIGGGLFEQRIELTFRVTNPNDFELPIRGSVFDLAINDAPFARGVSRDAVVLPALGETLVKVEASTSTLGLMKQLSQLGSKKQLNYALTGHFNLDGMGVSRLSFERASELGANPFAADAPAN